MGGKPPFSLTVAFNATAPLTTPTYDGSGQAIHPDVYDAGVGNTLHGHRYWMCMTPYPGSNDDYENPSLLVSSDGLAWSVPAGVTNPVVPAVVAPDHNADGDLVVDGTDMHIFYMERTPGGTWRAKHTSSTNSTTWSTPTTLFTATFGSPAVLKVGSTWHMWHLDIVSSAYVMRHRTASAATGPWSSGTVCTLTNMPGGRSPWHMDVVLDEDGSTFHCLLNTTATTGSGDRLLIMRGDSTGNLWRAGPELITPGLAGNFDDNLAYRGCIVLSVSDYRIWYCGQSTGGVWRTGYTTIPRTYEPALP